MFCPVLPAFEAVAHTLVHDAKIAGDFSLPTERMASVTVPTLMIYGGRPPGRGYTSTRGRYSGCQVPHT
jgi:hypothetical protein